MRLFTSIIAAAIAVPALAQSSPAVSVASEIQAVKVVTGPNGAQKVTVVPAVEVLPGTPLIFWLRYKNNGTVPASGFVMNNPISKNVIFTALGKNSEWGVVSVDGGKTFGALATLKIKDAKGSSRPAGPRDVTHLRWTFKTPIAAGQSGSLSFYGVVK